MVLFVDGHRRCAVPHGLPRPDLSARWDIEGLDSSGLLLGLDLSSWSPGRHTLAAIAYGNDGRAVGRSTHFRLGADDQARRALRRSDGVPGIRASASRQPAPRAEAMTVCPLNADPGLERSLAEQTVDGCAVDHHGDLSSCLRAIAQRRDGHQLLVSGGVTLEPHAVEELLTALATRPQADVVYTDESPRPSGGDPQPFLKPSWSPELLASADYVGPLVTVSAHAARAALDAHPARWSRSRLLLRLVDTHTTVEHLPAAVFSRKRPERADGDPARLAIERLASIQGRRAQVTELSQPGCRHVGWEIHDQARVSIVLLTGGKPIAVDCVRSIREHTTYHNVEVVIVDASGTGQPSGWCPWWRTCPPGGHLPGALPLLHGEQPRGAGRHRRAPAVPERRHRGAGSPSWIETVSSTRRSAGGGRGRREAAVSRHHHPALRGDVGEAASAPVTRLLRAVRGDVPAATATCCGWRATAARSPPPA